MRIAHTFNIKMKMQQFNSIKWLYVSKKRKILSNETRKM